MDAEKRIPPEPLTAGRDHSHPALATRRFSPPALLPETAPGCGHSVVKACVGMKMNERLDRELRQFTADHEWIEGNRETLLKQYADQWIAVKDGQVIASDPDLSSLRSRLSDPAHTSIQFLTRE